MSLNVLNDDSLLAFRSAFGVEHDSPEEIHCAVELRITGVSNAIAVFILEALKTAGCAFEHNVPLFLGSHWHRNVGRDAFLMNNLVAGSVILGGSETESRAVGQWQNALD